MNEPTIEHLAIVVAAQDEELRLLRQMHELQQQMIDAQASALASVTDAITALPALIRRFERVHKLVERHDHSLRAMHSGLHMTSDPVT